jgi:hypothetical protein
MVLSQIRGFVSNLWTTAMGATWEGYLPPSIVSLIKFLGQAVPDAFGFGSREDMIRGSVVLAILSILSSIITLGATLFAVAVFGVTFTIGVIRHIPIVDENWPLPSVTLFE